MMPASSPSAQPLHAQVLVFLPAYEGSRLYDLSLGQEGEAGRCVWGEVEALRRSSLYLSLRMPNPLEARPMLTAGPIDVYQRFVSTLTRDQEQFPDFKPYTLGADFFIFAYDWRQDLLTVTAPEFGEALKRYARIYAEQTGQAEETVRFVLIGHSMGGLVARTLLNLEPTWAERWASLTIVGTPNQGSIKALKTLITGPGGLKENAVTFPASLLRLLPTDVDYQTTKLVAISRPSLYELLPIGNLRWEIAAADGQRTLVPEEDLLTVDPWRGYWPSAEYERLIYLQKWLPERVAEGRSRLNPKDCAFCQDEELSALQRIFQQVKAWRAKLGTLRQTQELLTTQEGGSRLHVVFSSGLLTPSGLITRGSGDASEARYTFTPFLTGDETVTRVSALDDLEDLSQVMELNKIPHGRLMNHRLFLDYLLGRLSRELML